MGNDLFDPFQMQTINELNNKKNEQINKTHVYCIIFFYSLCEFYFFLKIDKTVLH